MILEAKGIKINYELSGKQQTPVVVRDDLLLQLLLVELHWRRRRNEHPDQHDYERRFPGHVDVVRKAFCRLEVAASKAPRLAELFA